MIVCAQRVTACNAAAASAATTATSWLPNRSGNIPRMQPNATPRHLLAVITPGARSARQRSAGRKNALPRKRTLGDGQLHLGRGEPRAKAHRIARTLCRGAERCRVSARMQGDSRRQAARTSIWPEMPMPSTSDTMLPHPAAAMVDKLSAPPTVASMTSPERICKAASGTCKPMGQQRKTTASMAHHDAVVAEAKTYERQ